MFTEERYQYYRDALRGESMPLAFFELKAFDANVDYLRRLLQVAGARSSWAASRSAASRSCAASSITAAPISAISNYVGLDFEVNFYVGRLFRTGSPARTAGLCDHIKQ